MILGVNIDHVATVRQARLGDEPDPVMAATLAVLGGADGITLHLREDRRHVNDRDLKILREVVTVELNLEMAATDEMIGIAIDTGPDMVTLVPEKRQEMTTEGGLDIKANKGNLEKAIKRIQGEGIPVSLFINPDADDIDLSRDISADMVEIHTGPYADAAAQDRIGELDNVKEAVKRATSNGLLTNAGHGLNYSNVQPIASLEDVRGLYIGHSIVSRAVLVGFEKAVRQMREFIDRSQ